MMFQPHAVSCALRRGWMCVSGVTTSVMSSVDLVCRMEHPSGIAACRASRLEALVLSIMIRVLGAQLSALDSSRTLSSVQLQLEQIIDKAHREAIECHQQILQDTQQCLVSVHQLAHQLQLPTPSSSCGEYITHTLSSLQDTRHSLQITKQQRIDTIQPIKQEIRQLVLALHQPASIDTSILDLQHDLSINYIQTLHNQLNIAKDLHEYRTNNIHNLAAHIKTRLLEMDINDNDMHNYILYDNLDAFPLSEKTIKSLEMALSDLEKTRIEKLKQKEALLEKINALWLKLDIPEADKSSFKKSFSQFQEIEIVSNKIFSFLESEVERLELLKRNNIKRVIEKMRLEIQELWSSLRYCEEQKKEFPQFKENEELNESLLESHEKYRDILLQKRQELEYIFDLIKKRGDLLEIVHQGAISAQDPNRYKSRDSFKILKKEEECRLIVSKKLPKLDEKLKSEIENWESKNGMHLLIDGERYLDSLGINNNSSKPKESTLKPAVDIPKSITKKAAMTPSSSKSTVQKIKTETPSVTKILITPAKNALIRSRTEGAKMVARNFNDSSLKGFANPKVTLKKKVDAKQILESVKDLSHANDEMPQDNEASVAEITTEVGIADSLKGLMQEAQEMENQCRFVDAVEIYTKAIAITKSPQKLSRIYWKRSSMYRKVNDFNCALEDSNTSAKLSAGISSLH